MVERDQLRQHVSRVLDQQAEEIVAEAVAVLPFAAGEEADAGEGGRNAAPLLQLLVTAVRDGTLEGHHAAIVAPRKAVAGMPPQRAFELVYLLERAATDALAADESFGATSEPWPVVAQLIRRASFDVLAAVAGDLGSGSLFDGQTGLYTRAALYEALEKEIQRAERLSRPFALILFDLDRVADITRDHGHGVADRLIERLAIIIHSYFREQDWVSRSDDDEFAVLLPETQRANAIALAEDVRKTVETRMAVRDHRSGAQVPVTVSAALLAVEHPDATLRARELLNEAQLALKRAKQAGRNRVEIVDIQSRPPSS